MNKKTKNIIFIIYFALLVGICSAWSPKELLDFNLCYAYKKDYAKSQEFWDTLNNKSFFDNTTSPATQGSVNEYLFNSWHVNIALIEINYLQVLSLKNPEENYSFLDYSFKKLNCLIVTSFIFITFFIAKKYNLSAYK